MRRKPRNEEKSFACSRRTVLARAAERQRRPFVGTQWRPGSANAGNLRQPLGVDPGQRLHVLENRIQLANQVASLVRVDGKTRERGNVLHVPRGDAH